MNTLPPLPLMLMPPEPPFLLPPAFTIYVDVRELRIIRARRNGYDRSRVPNHPPEPVACNLFRACPTVFMRPAKAPFYGSIYKEAKPWAESTPS